MAERLFECARRLGSLPRQPQVADSLLRFHRRSGLQVMIGQVRRVRLQVGLVDALDRLRDAQVEELASGQGDATDQRLADQLVGEREAGLAGTLRGGGDEVGTLRPVHGVEQGVLTSTANRTKKVEAEAAADHGRGREYLTALFAQPLQAPPDDQANAFGYVQLVDVEVRAPPPLCIQQLSLLAKVFEHLFHEEGITFRLGVDRPNQRAGRFLATEGPQHGLYTRLREALERVPLGQTLADQLFKRIR